MLWDVACGEQGCVALEKTRGELRSTQRQCELVKNLLADATAENEIMYEVRICFRSCQREGADIVLPRDQAFNEELDGMFNDANLPEDEAWTAMTHDLRDTKEARNNLSRENG